MILAALLMIGGTLFVNGLVLLGKVDGKSAAPFNIITGVLAIATPFYILSSVAPTDRTSLDTILGVGPMLLFAFTFLWVGINAVTDNAPEGIGWYCLWVAVVAIGFSLVNFIRFDAVPEGIIWLNWSLLWGLFWALLALGKGQIAAFTGWAAVIMSVWTVTLQAFLNQIGAWQDVPDWVFIAATIGTLVASLILARRVAPPEPVAVEPLTETRMPATAR
ncbi:MAG: transporter [Solirubrobacterales bacterium]|nr:transporter [Solirubrobacterales bacterium]